MANIRIDANLRTLFDRLYTEWVNRVVSRSDVVILPPQRAGSKPDTPEYVSVPDGFVDDLKAQGVAFKRI